MIPGQYKSSVVSFRNDRMGARLLAILNAIRVSRDYDLPYFFTWTTHGRASAELQAPTEIFDAAYFDAHFVSHDDFKAINDASTDLMAMPIGSNADTIPQGRDAGDAFLCMATDLLVLPWEDTADIAPRFAAAVSALEFSKVVTDAMAAVDKVLQGSGTAFHIRRGDIIYDPITSNQLWSNKYIPREYYEIMANRLVLDPDARILVFSDEPAEIARLKKISPQIITPDEVLPPHLTLAQRDFMEIYAMSRCHAIMGPPGSGFSAAAALMGNREVTYIRDALTDDEQRTAMELLSTRLEERSALFLGDGDIGQNFAFAVEHLNTTNQSARALALLESYADAGFSKVYFFRLLLEQYLKCEKFDHCAAPMGRLAKANLDVAIPARLEMHWSELNRIAAIGAARAHDTQALHDRLALAFWFHPTSRLAHGMLSQLVSEDQIDLQKFAIPMDPALYRPVPTPALRAGDPALLLPAADPDRKYRALAQDLFVWDWRNVLGRTLIRGFQTPQSVTRARDIFAHQFPRHCPAPSVASALGVYARALENHDEAIKLQRQALSGAPDNPLFLRRMAASLLAVDPQDPIALVLLEKAAQYAPNQSLYQAELAQCLIAQRQVDRGISILQDLCKAPFVLPEIPFLAARAMRQNRQSGEAALALIDQALAIAPHLRRYMHLRVHILADMKDWDAANHQIAHIVAQFGEGGDLTALRGRIAA